jgi:hypothetical protein
MNWGYKERRITALIVLSFSDKDKIITWNSKHSKCGSMKGGREVMMNKMWIDR